MIAKLLNNLHVEMTTNYLSTRYKLMHHMVDVKVFLGFFTILRVSCDRNFRQSDNPVQMLSSHILV
jgi:hypothetical protein